MSLFPGGRKKVGVSFVIELDDAAMANSMAQAIEDAMNEYHQFLKGQPLPATNKTERRMLFVSIARGVLGYLRDHQNVISTQVNLQSGAGTVNLHVDMDKV
jgi:hypothetical protein